MCGITAVIGSTLAPSELRVLAVAMSQRQRHRGPDWSGVWLDGAEGRGTALAHERLSIVDPFAGGQPIISRDGRLVLTVNGEIYNHVALRKEFEGRCVLRYFFFGYMLEFLSLLIVFFFLLLLFLCFANPSSKG
jgi:asparagine synthase (glutamine-hydrolysing)